MVLVIAALGSVAAGLSVYAPHQPSGVDLVRLQWAASLTDKALDGIRLQAAQFRGALDWDMRALIPGYVVGLLVACYLGRRVFWTARARAWALLGIVAAVLAGVCNVAHDLMLLKVLSDGLRKGALPDWVEALSFVKFAALLVAAAAAVVAIMVTIGRLAMSNRVRRRWEEAFGEIGTKDRVIPPPDIEHPAGEGGTVSSLPLAEQDWWDGISTGPRARWAQGFASPADRPEDAVGICVSGSGIRSASVALGALCALRDNGVLGNANYLVSVSGGGYTTGGLQLAMTKATDGLQGPHQETRGELVFAQADLTPDMPYQLLDFPQLDSGFPNDSTGDQFFNAGQFDSYQTLRYFIGHKAARRQAASSGEQPLPQRVTTITPPHEPPAAAAAS
jgi:hypothetical protein